MKKAKLTPIQLENVKQTIKRLEWEVKGLYTVTGLLRAMKPFVEIVKSTSGAIPTERLSFNDWHTLVKAYDDVMQDMYETFGNNPAEDQP